MAGVAIVTRFTNGNRIDKDDDPTHLTIEVHERTAFDSVSHIASELILGVNRDAVDHLGGGDAALEGGAQPFHRHAEPDPEDTLPNHLLQPNSTVGFRLMIQSEDVGFRVEHDDRPWQTCEDGVEQPIKLTQVLPPAMELVVQRL